MTARLPATNKASALLTFFAVAFGGIAVSLIASHWQSREEMMRSGEPVSGVVRLYYGRKRARHVAPESFTGPALGADFAEVFVASLARREIQEKGRTDLKEFRPVAYPPLALWLYGWLRNVPYSQALAIHSLVSLGIFLLAVALVYLVSGLMRHFWKIALLAFAVCFYTPTGFSHFERGQFDLYVSAGVFLCIAVVYLERYFRTAGVAGGVLSAIKLSSLPFLGTFSLAAFFSDAKGRRHAYLLAPAIVVLSLLIFAPELGRLVDAMNHMEWAAAVGRVPVGEESAIRGVSFLLILPPLLAKSIQILSMLAFIGATWIRRASPPERHIRFQAAAFPFALAMVIQGMAFGAGSWEYRIVSLLGTAAGFVLWVETVPGLERLKTACGLGFGIFLFVSSRAFHFLVWKTPSWQAPGMSAFYLAASLGFLAIALYILSGRKHTSPEETSANPLAEAIT